MFGVDKIVIQIVGIIVIGIVLICCTVMFGCAPDAGSEFAMSQMALMSKTNIDSSKHDKSQDNSIIVNLKDSDKPAEQTLEESVSQSFPKDKEEAESVATVVAARAQEREKVILAQAELKEKVIRAEEEKWRILVWVVGGGAVVVAALALFIRSPIDRKKKNDE